MSNQFLDLITKRRTIYAIGKNIEQSPERLTDLIQTAIKQSPSAFNSQSSRAVILFNTEHEKFWGIVADKLKSYAKDEASAAKTTAKMASFAAGVGTYYSLKIKQWYKRCRSNSRLMRITSLSGQSILLRLRNLPHGQHYILKA